MEDLKSLIEKAQTGDLDAYGMIVRRFQDMAVGYAYSIIGDFHLAEDAAQEAFIEAYPNLSKVYGPAAFPGWLRKIIFKHCDRLARRKRIEIVSLEAAINLPSKEKEPAEAVEEKEMKDNVLTAIAALPEKERVVTTLFYINGYSHQEIAEFLEIPVTTVNHRLRSSRKRLKQRMITMVQDNLQEKRPSKDGRYANKVQLFNAAETGNVDKVKELLTSDATRAALYDFLKARAKEQQMSVEELVVWLIERHKKQVEWEANERKKREKEEKELRVVPLLEGLDAEAAKQKAWEFFESLINKDFEKANAIQGKSGG
jgi:RNA polymerase sigma factor (sigma-70 family)